MTRHDVISHAALQARARDVMATHVVALLAGDDARADFSDLTRLGRVEVSDILRKFALTSRQRDLFFLCSAPELGPKSAAALAAHPLSQQGRATPALIETVLGPDTASELTETALLRQSGLITLEPGSGFAHRAATLPAAVIAALHGVPEFDAALIAAITPALPTEPPEQALVSALTRRATPQPILTLATDDPVQAGGLGASVFAELGLRPVVLTPDLLAIPPAQAARLLNRDLVLTQSGVILPATEDGARIADRVSAPMFLWGQNPARTLRPQARYELSAQTPNDPFPLEPADRQDVRATHQMGLGDDLWALARDRAGRALDGLAERITPQARWDDLVLPDAQMQQLRQLAAFRTHREQVLGTWGFREKSARGLGLSALFSGASGTGKTMAAEILASELGDQGALDLYRVDLSSMISKYIGETEKNIARIFDAAERAGAILIFDEGEALFGKRSSDVKDSLDRHSNSETAYLLQRLESFTGIAIVTTNLKVSVDDAFLRRFRAVVDFPFPDAEHRARIWRSVFPTQTPLDGVDFEALSRLAISGGFIRSIALTAAFLAAETGGPVTMSLLQRAARQEYGKLGKTLSEAELRGLR